jgi:hypothetical protein
VCADAMVAVEVVEEVAVVLVEVVVVALDGMDERGARNARWETDGAQLPHSPCHVLLLFLLLLLPHSPCCCCDCVAAYTPTGACRPGVCVTAAAEACAEACRQ